MRPIMLLALIIHLGGCCGGGHGRFVNGSGEQTAEDLQRRFPIAADANIRADELARTATASVHLVQVRGGETPHRHALHDLTVTVLAGEGILTLDGARRSLHQGDVAVVPRGTPHWFVRSGDGVAVALVVFTPPLDRPDTVPIDGDVDSPAGTR
jgi:quercetin dioxygenase-like cupin family protein